MENLDIAHTPNTRRCGYGSWSNERSSNSKAPARQTCLISTLSSIRGDGLTIMFKLPDTSPANIISQYQQVAQNGKNLRSTDDFQGYIRLGCLYAALHLPQLNTHR